MKVEIGLVMNDMLTGTKAKLSQVWVLLTLSGERIQTMETVFMK